MPATSAHGEDKPSPRQLIDAAHKTSDLMVLGSYILSASVVVNPGTSKEQTGSLAVYRDRDRARVDMAVAGGTETRITLGNKNYLDPDKMLIASAWPFEFDRSWDPQHAERNIFLVRPAPQSVSRRKIRGIEAWCVETKHDSGKDQICIDVTRNIVLVVNEKEFSDYTTVNGVMFPQTIRIAYPPGVIIEIRKIQISVYPVDATLFSVPAHTMEFETCDHETPPRIVDSPIPERSNLARHEINATVRLYVFIDKEGKVAAMRFQTRGPETLENKIKNAVMNWRFKPATCDGQPVNVATTLELDGYRF